MKENIYETSVDLKKYNSYKIGGKADYLIRPTNILQLKNVIDYLVNNNIKYYVLGSGTNVVLPDEDFNGAIIKLDKLDNIEIDSDYLYVDCGISLNALINECLDHGYVNLINLYGIPGTVGGAIIGNAGSFGTEIFDYLESVTVLSDGYIKTINKNVIKYGYRYTEFKESNTIILGAVFKLEKGDVEKSKEIIKKNLEKRKNSQPLEYNNAGSVFKNPSNKSAGALIEECNLKGFNINGAYVSSKHANFIINKGTATSKDIKELIEVIKCEVKKKTGINLELEQVIVKW